MPRSVPRASAIVAAVLMTVAFVVGCSGSSDSDPGSTASSSAAGSSPLATTSAKSAPLAAPTTPAKVLPDSAQGVVEALAAQGLSITGVIAYTADTDPNKLLGRPGQYTSKAAFVDTRVDTRVDTSEKAGVDAGSVELGGGVETFADASQAQARMQYIQSVLQNSGGALGAEYDYLTVGVLLRVSGDLSPDQANGYQDALAAVSSEPVTAAG